MANVPELGRIEWIDDSCTPAQSKANSPTTSLRNHSSILAFSSLLKSSIHTLCTGTFKLHFARPNILLSFCPTQHTMKLNLATGLICLLASTEVVAASSWWSKASMLSGVQKFAFYKLIPSTVYNRWHESELERWLSDHSMSHLSF